MLSFHKENTALLNEKFQGILTTTILLSLLIQKSCVSDAYTDDTSNMKYHLHHLHLEKYFIQQKHDINLQQLC